MENLFSDSRKSLLLSQNSGPILLFSTQKHALPANTTFSAGLNTNFLGGKTSAIQSVLRATNEVGCNDVFNAEDRSQHTWYCLVGSDVQVGKLFQTLHRQALDGIIDLIATRAFELWQQMENKSCDNVSYGHSLSRFGPAACSCDDDEGKHPPHAYANAIVTYEERTRTIRVSLPSTVLLVISFTRLHMGRQIGACLAYILQTATPADDSSVSFVNIVIGGRDIPRTF